MIGQMTKEVKQQIASENVETAGERQGGKIQTEPKEGKNENEKQNEKGRRQGDAEAAQEKTSRERDG